MKSLWKKLVAIVLTVLLYGCGYQFAGRETHLPPGVVSLAIPTFANKTLEPGIEIPFTQAFLREFIRDRRVKVLDRQSADAILEGAIKSFLLESVSYDASGFALEYRTFVTIDLALKRRSGELLWRMDNLSESRWYRTSSNVLTNESNKNVAVQEIAGFVADRVRNRFFYNF